MHTYVFKASLATWTAAGLAGATWCAMAMAAITDSGGPVRAGLHPGPEHLLLNTLPAG
jgi:hypothetical protein